MLHTPDPKVADTEEFAGVLRTADAAWFNGGRQWNIVDSYANTLTYRELHEVKASVKQVVVAYAEHLRAGKESFGP